MFSHVFECDEHDAVHISTMAPWVFIIIVATISTKNVGLNTKIFSPSLDNYNVKILYIFASVKFTGRKLTKFELSEDIV